MIKQCCAVFNRHIPATENTWRPRKEGEEYEEYRLRVVERGDGDLFRAWQIMETALEQRSHAAFALVARHLPESQRQALESDHDRAATVTDGDGQMWRLGHCRSCRMRMARQVSESDSSAAASSGCCDICETIAQENDIWAPHMPCKEISKKRKKKKKKKKRSLAEMGPSPEELLALHQSRQPAPCSSSSSSCLPAAGESGRLPTSAKRMCAGLEVGGEGMLLGMDLKPEQTLRPTLQHDAE